MSEQTKCKHEDAFSIDEGRYCPACDSIIAITCPSCGGQGWVEEDEYEGDWVNYSNDAITCPECKGSGWLLIRRGSSVQIKTIKERKLNNV